MKRIEVVRQVVTCTRCELHAQCTGPVPMRGDPGPIVVVGEAPGEQEDQLGMPFCLDPDHLVLMADLTWKSLGDVVVGDDLLAPDEFGPCAAGASGSGIRRWRIARVTAVHWRTTPRVRAVAGHGELVGSEDHLVLTSYGSEAKSKRWLPLGRLQVGRSGPSNSSSLSHVFEPWKPETSWDAGWLAGFLDGEGHVVQSRKVRAGFAQNAGPTRERALEVGRKLGFAWTDYGEQRRNGVVCGKHYVRGGVSGTMEFLGRVRPERLLTNFRRAVEGFGPGLKVHPSRVECREKVGVGDVVDISTTTGTFIADGFVVHNCGPAGKKLRDLMAEAGLTPSAYVNTASCFPHGTPKPEHVAACEDNKWAQIDFLAPDFLLLVGKVALKGMRADLDLKRGRGRPFLVRNLLCFATYHPAAALRNSTYEMAMASDLARFKDLVDAGPDRWMEFIPPSCAACPVDPVFYEEAGLGWCEVHLPASLTDHYRALQVVLADDYTRAKAASERRRDEAIAAVADAADPDWLALAWDTLVSYLKTHEIFFVDDFWSDTGLPKPREARALGSVVMRAARENLMVKSGIFRKSTASNMTEKPVWKSLVYGASS